MIKNRINGTVDMQLVPTNVLFDYIFPRQEDNLHYQDEKIAQIGKQYI